jgi:hypothetical protein
MFRGGLLGSKEGKQKVFLLLESDLTHLKDQILDGHAAVGRRCVQTFTDDSNLTSGAKLYRCELDEPPALVKIDMSTIHPDIQLVATLEVRLTAADFQNGEHKICRDGVTRYRLPFIIKVSCGDRTKRLRATAWSTDEERRLGGITIRYQ